MTIQRKTAARKTRERGMIPPIEQVNRNVSLGSRQITSVALHMAVPVPRRIIMVPRVMIRGLIFSRLIILPLKTLIAQPKISVNIRPGTKPALLMARQATIEIFATRSNERINQIKQRYFQLFNQKDLVKEINDETSGFFRKILLELLNANRSTNTIPDNNECGDCAKRLYNSQFDKKDTLHRNKSCIFKTKTKNQKFFERINKKRFFLPRKRSNYSKINFKKELPLNRCSSAKLNDRYKIEKILDENNENERNKNMYIIRVLKELNYYATIKCNELEEICAKETKAQNNIKNLLQLCAEDLNTKNKEEKNKKKRKKLEEKIFILSYVYDNCLNNGEKKHLKRNYSMFIPKKNKFF